jgi:hypothetical protein
MLQTHDVHIKFHKNIDISQIPTEKNYDNILNSTQKNHHYLHAFTFNKSQQFLHFLHSTFHYFCHHLCTFKHSQLSECTFWKIKITSI